MSYEKQNWATGDIITADKLNHMEDGISTATGGGVTWLHAETTLDHEIGEWSVFVWETVDPSTEDPIFMSEQEVDAKLSAGPVIIYENGDELIPTHYGAYDGTIVLRLLLPPQRESDSSDKAGRTQWEFAKIRTW